jgi:hypothetical protein
MRIIAGKAGRVAIKVPPAVARPTTDFVRQAIFSILGERVWTRSPYERGQYPDTLPIASNADDTGRCSRGPKRSVPVTL